MQDSKKVWATERVEKEVFHFYGVREKLKVNINLISAFICISHALEVKSSFFLLIVMST